MYTHTYTHILLSAFEDESVHFHGNCKHLKFSQGSEEGLLFLTRENILESVLKKIPHSFDNYFFF